MELRSQNVRQGPMQIFKSASSILTAAKPACQEMARAAQLHICSIINFGRTKSESGNAELARRRVRAPVHARRLSPQSSMEKRIDALTCTRPAALSRLNGATTMK